MKQNHPIQPLSEDESGILRFKENGIVRYLLDNGPFDMNHLAIQNFTKEDREQFAQLIGYSLSGFGELGYVSDETYDTAKIMSAGKEEKDARIKTLQSILNNVRKGMIDIVPQLFKIHPDDLMS